MRTESPDLPTVLYRCPGPHLRPGGTYDYKGVYTSDEFSKVIAEGWYQTMPEAVDAYENPPRNIDVNESTESKRSDDESPPTREEMESMALSLGVKFNRNLSDAKLINRIDEALGR